MHRKASWSSSKQFDRLSNPIRQKLFLLALFFMLGSLLPACGSAIGKVNHQGGGSGALVDPTKCDNADHLDTVALPSPQPGALSALRESVDQTIIGHLKSNVYVSEQYSSPTLLGGKCTPMQAIGQFSLGDGVGKIAVYPPYSLANLAGMSSGSGPNSAKLAIGYVYSQQAVDVDAPQLEYNVLPAGKTWFSVSTQLTAQETIRAFPNFFSQLVYVNPMLILDLLGEDCLGASFLGKPPVEGSVNSGASTTTIMATVNIGNNPTGFTGAMAQIDQELFADQSISKFSLPGHAIGINTTTSQASPEVLPGPGQMNVLVILSASGSLVSASFYPPLASLGTVTISFLRGASSNLAYTKVARGISVPRVVKNLVPPQVGIISGNQQVLGATGGEASESGGGGEGNEVGGS